MGRIVTPKYRLDMELLAVASGKRRMTEAMGWNVRGRGMVPGHGKPTFDNLTKYVKAFEASTMPGRPNFYPEVGPMQVLHAVISENTGYDGKVVVEYSGVN